jgi:hypothetical protein
VALVFERLECTLDLNKLTLGRHEPSGCMSQIAVETIGDLGQLANLALLRQHARPLGLSGTAGDHTALVDDVAFEGDHCLRDTCIAQL